MLIFASFKNKFMETTQNIESKHVYTVYCRTQNVVYIVNKCNTADK